MKYLFAVSLALALSGAHAQTREVTRIAGDVYRFQNQFHFSIFVITDDGVVVTDPINAEAARWLRAEIAKLTDRPITHLVYSHSHGDHASGAAEFGPVPTVIAHANAPPDIDGVVPTVRFASELTFLAGKHRFELTYLGPGHGTDLIATVVRPENVGFVVDAVSAKRLPYRDFPGADVDDWADQIRVVETLSFDVLAGGHGPLGVKADVTDAREYMEVLRAEVLAGLKAGKSAQALEQSVTMDAYRDWVAYDQWRELNVRGMARFLVESGAVE